MQTQNKSAVYSVNNLIGDIWVENYINTTY